MIIDGNTNVILVNFLLWMNYRNKELFVIEYFLLHEMRHIYQHIQMAKYREGKNDVDNQYIEKWIKENENYEQSVNNEGNETTYFQNKIASQVLMLLYPLLGIINIHQNW